MKIQHTPLCGGKGHMIEVYPWPDTRRITRVEGVLTVPFRVAGEEGRDLIVSWPSIGAVSTADAREFAAAIVAAADAIEAKARELGIEVVK